jgi:hypothetical protein
LKTGLNGLDGLNGLNGLNSLNIVFKSSEVGSVPR